MSLYQEMLEEERRKTLQSRAQPVQTNSPTLGSGQSLNRPSLFQQMLEEERQKNKSQPSPLLQSFNERHGITPGGTAEPPRPEVPVASPTVSPAAGGAAIPTSPERPDDLSFGSNVKTALTTTVGAAASVAKGIMGSLPTIVPAQRTFMEQTAPYKALYGALDKVTQYSAKQVARKHEAILKQGGLTSATLYDTATFAQDMAVKLIAAGAGMKGGPPASSFVPLVKKHIKSGIDFAARMYITTEGSPEEKAKAAAYGAVFSAVGGVVGGKYGRIAGAVANVALGETVMGGAAQAVEKAKHIAELDGYKWDNLSKGNKFKYWLAAATPQLLSEIGMGAASRKELGSGKRPPPIPKQPPPIPTTQEVPSAIPESQGRGQEAVQEPIRTEIEPIPTSKESLQVQPESATKAAAGQGKTPELLPPEQYRPSRIRREGSAARPSYTSLVSKDGTAYVGGNAHFQTAQMAQDLGLGMPFDIETSMPAFTRTDGTSYGLHEEKIATKRVIWLDHAEAIMAATKTQRPVSAAAVDAYRIKLPEDYVREGDKYVFKPSTEPTAVQPQGAAGRPVEPAAITPGQKAPEVKAAPPTQPPPVPPRPPTTGAASPEEPRPQTRNLSLLSTEGDVRRMMTGVDVAMESTGYPRPQQVKEWEAKAAELHDANPREAYQELVAGKNDYVDPVQVKKSIKALSTSGAEDLRSMNLKNVERAVTAGVNMRLQGTAMGRGFRARRDPLQSPQDRIRSMVNDLLTAPTARDVAIMETATDTKKLNIIRKQAQRTLAVLKRLKEMGIDATNLSDDIINDRRKLNAVLRELQASRASFWDKEFEFWRNAILSGIPTQSANISGSLANSAYEYMLLKPVQATLNALTGNSIKSATTWQDLVTVYKAMVTSKTWKLSLQNAIESWATEQPVTGGGMKVEQASSGVAIGGTPGRIIRVPQRGLLFADEFAKTAIMQMEVSAHAMQEARAKGLTAAEREQYVASEIANPDSKAWQDSLDTAKRLTLQEEVGAVSNLLMRWRNDPGFSGFAARHLFPFIVTATNAIKTGIRRTPIGTLKVLKDLPATIRNPTDKAMREISEQFIAWGLTTWLHGIVNEKDENGLPKYITGSASSNKGEREAQYRTAPPQSFKIGGEWKSFARLEPLSTGLTLMVDSMRRDGSNMGERTYRSLTSLVRDKTFLRSISDILQLIETARSREPMAALSDWSANFASSYMPSLFKGIARSVDPYVRNYMVDDPDNHWADWLKRTGQKALPVGSLLPPPKIDIWGREIAKYNPYGNMLSDAAYRLLTPMPAQKEVNPVNLDRMLFNWNNKHPDGKYWPTIPNATLTGKTRMNEEQYHAFLSARGEKVIELASEAEFNFDNPTQYDIKRLRRFFSIATKIASREAGVTKKQLPQEDTDNE